MFSEVLENRICLTCNKLKSINEFHKCNKTKSGIRSKCKDCRLIEKDSRDYKKEYSNGRNRIINNVKNWRKVNPEKQKLQVRKKLLRDYGLSLEDYEKLLIIQNHKCAICKGVELKRQFSVDHCHNTGKVRGLLCKKCNSGLGFFKDSLDILREAVKYLEK